MTDFTHHPPKLLTEADAAADLAGVPRPNDLPSVGTEDARQKFDKAWRVIASLSDGTQDWTMSVPARPDSDPDLVISDALRCARALVSERDALRTENESLLRGLRGKHTLTGATYEHLVSERDELASRVTKLAKALTEARRWIGDGECSDGLPREYWTGDHTAVVELVDAALASKEQP